MANTEGALGEKELTCHNPPFQWEFFGTCMPVVAGVCKANTNIRCLYSPLRFMLKICNNRFDLPAANSSKNLLMKTCLRDGLLNSQSLSFPTTCSVLGTNKWGPLLGHLSSIGSWRQGRFLTSLALSSQISFLCKEWESFLARSVWVVLQYFHGTLGRTGQQRQRNEKK